MEQPKNIVSDFLNLGLQAAIAAEEMRTFDKDIKALSYNKQTPSKHRKARQQRFNARQKKKK